MNSKHRLRQISRSKVKVIRHVNCGENVPDWRLLRALWRKAKYSNYYSINGLTPPAEPTPNEYQMFCNQQSFLDHIHGKPIKVSFEMFPRIEATHYDNLFGVGAVERCMRDVLWDYDLDPDELSDLEEEIESELEPDIGPVESEFKIILVDSEDKNNRSLFWELIF